MLHFYVLDLETTGLNSQLNEITEISIIRCSDKVQLTEMVKCDYPERASYDALRLTNKTIDDLKKGLSKSDVINKVNRFFEQDGQAPNARCIIGHNIISFDKRFLHNLWGSKDKEFPADLYLDTIKMTQEYLKSPIGQQTQLIKTATGRTAVNLHACCDMMKIRKFAEKHSAISDTRNTYLLWNDLIKNKGVDHLPLIKNHPHRTPKEEDNSEFDAQE